MTEAEWQSATDPRPMLEFLRGKASDRKAVLFVVATLKAVSSDNSRKRELLIRLEAAERYAEGCDPVSTLREVWGGNPSYPETGYLWATALLDNEGVGILYDSENVRQRALPHLRDIFNPFRPVEFDPAWRSETVSALAVGIYAERAFDRLPILADALEEAGCDQPDILNHCRGPGPHVRGCWAVDLVLGKE